MLQNVADELRQSSRTLKGLPPKDSARDGKSRRAGSVLTSGSSFTVLPFGCHGDDPEESGAIEPGMMWQNRRASAVVPANISPPSVESRPGRVRMM
jgi:hypothetical protein